jgi:TRAP-type mannitol/chloroaromatic compound transport system permease small subunit
MLQAVDKLSEWIGKGVAWLIPLLILELVYDTAARYLFNTATGWSYDVSYMLYGAIFMLGASHTLVRDGHVRIEIIYHRVSPRARALIDALGYLLLYLPAMGALLYFGLGFALKSWRMGETSGASMWSPPIYPFKAVLPLAAFLLLLQGTVNLIRCLQTFFRRG